MHEKERNHCWIRDRGSFLFVQIPHARFSLLLIPPISISGGNVLVRNVVRPAERAERSGCVPECAIERRVK